MYHQMPSACKWKIQVSQASAQFSAQLEAKPQQLVWMQILVVSTLQNPYSNLSKPKCKLNNVAVKPEKRIIATLNNHHYCYITGPNRQTGLVLIACLLDHSAVRLSLFNHLVSERNVWRHSLKKASSFSKKAKYLKTLLSLAHHQTRAVWTDWPQNWLTIIISPVLSLSGIKKNEADWNWKGRV